MSSEIKFDSNCSNCQWNFDKVFCGEYSKTFPGPLDYPHYIHQQLIYSHGKALHATCARRLREKYSFLKRRNPDLEPLIQSYTILPSNEDVFCLRKMAKSTRSKKRRQRRGNKVEKSKASAELDEAVVDDKAEVKPSVETADGESKVDKEYESGECTDSDVDIPVSFNKSNLKKYQKKDKAPPSKKSKADNDL